MEKESSLDRSLYKTILLRRKSKKGGGKTLRKKSLIKRSGDVRCNENIMGSEGVTGGMFRILSEVRSYEKNIIMDEGVTKTSHNPLSEITLLK